MRREQEDDIYDESELDQSGKQQFHKKKKFFKEHKRDRKDSITNARQKKEERYNYF